MARWSGERIGRWSLRLDAAYCAVLGVGLVIGAPDIAVALPLPVWLVAAVGVAVVGWAGMVLAMLARLPLRTALRCVMTVNLPAAVAVAAISATGAAVLVVLAVLTVAIDVALFAGSQAWSLRRMRVAAVA